MMIKEMYRKTLKRSKLLTASLVGFYVFIAILLLIIKSSDNGIANTVRSRSSFSRSSYSRSQAENSSGTSPQDFQARN
jgi:hypothetical protein